MIKKFNKILNRRIAKGYSNKRVTKIDNKVLFINMLIK